MRVMVVGASKVGFALVRQICSEGADVIVIDKEPDKIDQITDAFDCNGYVGNGSNYELLKKAGVETTSLFIAVTKDDETNILCCSVAKKLGVKRTVAAVNAPEFDSQRDFVKSLGVDICIQPHKTAAIEVGRQINFAEDVELEHFGEGEVKIATLNIDEGNILVDAAMPEVQSRLGAQVLICAIDRGGKTLTPKGKQHIKLGDKITLMAIGSEMEKVLSAFGITEKNVKKVVIVGGSKIGYYLAENLISRGVKVTLVDNDERRCRELLEELPKANVLHGDGTDSEFMSNALKGAGACVAVTDNDEENLIISLFAKSFGLAGIAAEIDNENFDIMLRKSGINHTFSTQNVAIDKIIRDMRDLAITENINDTNNIKRLHALDNGKVEAVEFEISDDFPLLEISFKDSRFNIKNGVLVAVIVREGKPIVPDGSACIRSGDSIVVVSAECKLTKIADIFA